jgi:hypothetical protein
VAVAISGVAGTRPQAINQRPSSDGIRSKERFRWSLVIFTLQVLSTQLERGQELFHCPGDAFFASNQFSDEPPNLFDTYTLIKQGKMPLAKNALKFSRSHTYA